MNPSDFDENSVLEQQALRIYPLFTRVFELHQSLPLHDYDICGIYILFWHSIQSKPWCTGRLKNLIHEEDFSEKSIQLDHVHGLVESLGGAVYLQKKRLPTNCTVMDVFNTMSLAGIKNNKSNYINECMVKWGLGKRPVKLMFSIPSPMAVLRMQASGSRVCTIFLQLAELSRKHVAPLIYMDDMPIHAKDPLEFCLHDLRHMEHYMDDRIHMEQKGFFICMLRLRGGKPREYFDKECGLDKLCWQQLEYAISDMNCFVPHLLGYVLAKIVSAVERSGGGQDVHEKVKYLWGNLLSAFGMYMDSPDAVTNAARQAAEAMCDIAFRVRPGQPMLTAEEGEALRKWFRNQVGPEEPLNNERHTNGRACGYSPGTALA